MNFIRGTSLAVLLLSLCGAGLAQQTAKPVLSAAPVAPATAPAAVDSAPVPVTPDYVIGEEDSLKVDVWTDKPEPDLSGNGIPVRPDGNISLPLLGDIRASGLTPTQLAAQITLRLGKIVNDPTVNVTVLAVNSKRIYLVGAVSHVGPLPLRPGMTILQAIATAGGLSDYAKQKHIYILREQAGKQLTIPFDYSKALKKGDMQGISLKAGDTIVVPE
jgi:polysaccharide biosynthesis/export protein